MLVITIVVIGVVLARRDEKRSSSDRSGGGKSKNKSMGKEFTTRYLPLLSWILVANEDHCEDCRGSETGGMGSKADVDNAAVKMEIDGKRFAEAAAKQHAHSFVAYLQAIDDAAVVQEDGSDDLRSIDFFLEHRSPAPSTSQDSGRSSEAIVTGQDETLDA